MTNIIPNTYTAPFSSTTPLPSAKGEESEVTTAENAPRFDEQDGATLSAESQALFSSLEAAQGNEPDPNLNPGDPSDPPVYP